MVSVRDRTWRNKTSDVDRLGGAAGALAPFQRPRLAELLGLRELGILAAAVAFFFALFVSTPDFGTLSNLLDVARQISLLGIIAVGMTYLFVAGEIDLSVGSMYGFLGALMAVLTIREGWWPAASMAAVILAGAAFGFANGFVTTHFRIPSFIVTLGGLSVLRGASLVILNGYPLSGLEAPTFKAITSAYVFGVIPAQVFWMAGIMLVGGWALAKTKFGYQVYATGGNPTAATRVGIDTAWIKTACFMITGALTGLGAVLLVGWLRGASPLTGQGFELDVIAAVIIGGTNLFGGEGSILGTFLGAALMGMISNGLVLLGVSAFWEPIAKGSVIVLAVLLDVTIRRRQIKR